MAAMSAGEKPSRAAKAFSAPWLALGPVRTMAESATFPSRSSTTTLVVVEPLSMPATYFPRRPAEAGAARRFIPSRKASSRVDSCPADRGVKSVSTFSRGRAVVLRRFSYSKA